MIEFGGITYSIDIDVLDKLISPKSKKDESLMVTNRETKTYLDEKGDIISVEVTEYSSQKQTEVSAAKYDILRTMVDVIMDTDDDSDTTLGPERALEKTSLSYKIAFNTLLSYGVLKEKE